MRAAGIGPLGAGGRAAGPEPAHFDIAEITFRPRIPKKAYIARCARPIALCLVRRTPADTCDLIASTAVVAVAWERAGWSVETLAARGAPRRQIVKVTLVVVLASTLPRAVAPCIRDVVDGRAACLRTPSIAHGPEVVFAAGAGSAFKFTVGTRATTAADTLHTGNGAKALGGAAVPHTQAVAVRICSSEAIEISAVFRLEPWAWSGAAEVGPEGHADTSGPDGGPVYARISAS